MKQEAMVVMLPTEDRTQVHLSKEKTKNGYSYIIKLGELVNNGLLSMYQHLYIASDDEIKEGDWTYDTLNNCIEQVEKSTVDMINAGMLHNGNRKIIATTDKKLTRKIQCVVCFGEGELVCSSSSTTLKPCDNPDCENGYEYISIPQIQQSFIEEYCKLGGIDKVLVEYTDNELWCYECHKTVTDCINTSRDCLGYFEDNNKPKLSSDNTINISSINKIAKIYFSEEDLQDMQSSKFEEGLWNTWNYTLPSGEVIDIELHLGNED